MSKDVLERLNRHNEGAVRSTKSRRPWELVYKEAHTDYKSARLREIEIKSYKGGNAFSTLMD